MYQNNCYLCKRFELTLSYVGSLAEGLGTGLQNRLRRIPQEYKNEQWNEYEGSEDVAIDDVLAQEEATIVAIYNVDGHRISELQEGVNIIRLSNGNVLKVLHRAK